MPKIMQTHNGLGLHDEETSLIVPQRIAESVPPLAHIDPIDIETWPGVWVVLQSSGPFATQLSLRDRWGVRSFVPTVEQKPNGRWVTVPLFPGYVFAKPDLELVVETRRARLVWGYVPVPNQDQLTRELIDIRRMVAANPRAFLVENIVAGQEVRITRGPLRGSVGTVESLGGDHTFSVRLSMFGSCVAWKIAWSDLETI